MGSLQFNLKEYVETKLTPMIPMRTINGEKNGFGTTQVKPNTGDNDIIANMSGGNRGKVPWKIIEEIGFQDCDVIALEGMFSVWKKVATALYPVPLELHVPCREPIDYLLSMCNFIDETFDCNANPVHEINKCLIFMNRFADYQIPKWDQTLNGLSSATKLKCFNAVPIQPYIDHMATKLQPKRFVSSYVHRETNKKRDKKTECLLQDKELQETVRNYLVKKHAIFRFCQECKGSEDDLLHTTEEENVWAGFPDNNVIYGHLQLDKIAGMCTFY